MAYSGENSCKKDCSCDSCKGSHKSIKSEGFKEKTKALVDKTKETAKKIKTAVALGLGDTHGQEWTTTSNLSGSFPGAGTAAAAAYNIGKRTMDAFRESSEYIGSKQHLQDLIWRHKEDIENFKKAPETDSLRRAHLHMIAQKSLQNVLNHPLYSKEESQPMKPLSESSHKFPIGSQVKLKGKESIQGLDPKKVYTVGAHKSKDTPAGSAITHVLMDNEGNTHNINNAHIILQHSTFSKRHPVLTGAAKTAAIAGKIAAAAAIPVLEQNDENDVTKTLPIGIKQKGPGEEYGSVAKSAPAPKDTSKTGIIVGKTGEEKYKEIESAEPLKEGLDKNQFASTEPMRTRAAKMRVIGTVHKIPSLIDHANAAEKAHKNGNKEEAEKHMQKAVDLIFNTKKESVMEEDKYKKLAEAAFGSINNNNPFRSNSIEEDRTITIGLRNPFQSMFPGGIRSPFRKPITIKTKNDDNIQHEKPHDEPSHTMSDEDAIKTAKLVGLNHENPDHINLIKNLHKNVSSKENLNLKESDKGFKPREENLNQRFPDVEKDITEIMRESYKKRKMMEDATNVEIATPEQRNDWLEVGRGSMDIADYINKYKV